MRGGAWFLSGPGLFSGSQLPGGEGVYLMVASARDFLLLNAKMGHSKDQS